MSAKPGEGLSRFLSGPGRGPPARGAASQLGALRFRSYANDAREAEFEERAIMNLEQPVRDVDAEIRIDRRSGLRMYLSPRLLVRPNLKRNRKFVDSPREGSGFELPVPRRCAARTSSAYSAGASRHSIG